MSGEEEAKRGDLTLARNNFKGSDKDNGSKLFSVVAYSLTRGHCHKSEHGEFRMAQGNSFVEMIL